MIDKNYCCSSWLVHRYIIDDNKEFASGIKHKIYDKITKENLIIINDSEDLGSIIKSRVEEKYVEGKTGLFLSGGIDSAIVAAYLPKGIKAYTITCDAPNFVNETERAKKYAEINKLDLKIIKINWEDYLETLPILMTDAGSPVVAIEPQLYKAGKFASIDGIEYIFTGVGMDTAFGGLDKSHAKDWSYNEFIDFYTYIQPVKALIMPDENVFNIFENYRLENNKIKYHDIMLELHGRDSDGCFRHALSLAGIEDIPIAKKLRPKFLDITRIRRGEPKYLVYELFKKLYPDLEAPEKLPMPRAVDYWLRDYYPVRNEFIPNCTLNMTGEQKYLIFALEMFMNLIDKK